MVEVIILNWLGIICTKLEHLITGDAGFIGVGEGNWSKRKSLRGNDAVN